MVKVFIEAARKTVDAQIAWLCQFRTDCEISGTTTGSPKHGWKMLEATSKPIPCRISPCDPTECSGTILPQVGGRTGKRVLPLCVVQASLARPEISSSGGAR